MPAGEVRDEMTDGFNLVVDALELNGVQTIYGVVGIPVTDLARVAQAKGIRYIGFRQEQAAGHAAAAAGFLTQRPGICLTVSAPGFLNGLPALANATTNCFPMIQVSGSSDRAIVDLQQGDYEELDQMAAAKPLAKASFRAAARSAAVGREHRRPSARVATRDCRRQRIMGRHPRTNALVPLPGAPRPAWSRSPRSPAGGDPADLLAGPPGARKPRPLPAQTQRTLHNCRKSGAAWG